MNAVAKNDGKALKAMQAAFEEAMAACPDAVSKHHYAVAGTCVRLRIAGRRVYVEASPG